MAKILAIDDDSDVLDVISVLFELKRPNDIILTAPDGNSGIQMAKAENPDAVILDIGLPDVDGLEVFREIRRFSRVPVIFLTVRDDPKAVQLGQEVGADDYMTKPFSAEKLLERILTLLGSPTAP